MQTPTDTGYAFVDALPDGRVRVMVCSRVTEGQPVDVTAIHKQGQVLIDPSIQMLPAAEHGTYSADLVHVYADDGGVHVIPHASDAGPLIKALRNAGFA